MWNKGVVKISKGRKCFIFCKCPSIVHNGDNSGGHFYIHCRDKDKSNRRYCECNKEDFRSWSRFVMESYVAISIAATIWVCIDDSSLVLVLTTNPQFVHLTRVDIGPTLIAFILLLELWSSTWLSDFRSKRNHIMI